MTEQFVPNLEDLTPPVGYHTQNLKVVMVGTPMSMSKELSDAIVKSFQDDKILITGFIAGCRVDYDEESETNIKRHFEQRPRWVLPEHPNGARRKMLEAWIDECVVGKPYGLDFGVMRVGIDVLVYEPDTTHTKVLNAWFVQNGIPDGVESIEHNYAPANDSGCRTDIAVDIRGFIVQNEEVTKMAQQYLEREIAKAKGYQPDPTVLEKLQSTLPAPLKLRLAYLFDTKPELEEIWQAILATPDLRTDEVDKAGHDLADEHGVPVEEGFFYRHMFAQETAPAQAAAAYKAMTPETLVEVAPLIDAWVANNASEQDAELDRLENLLNEEEQGQYLQQLLLLYTFSHPEGWTYIDTTGDNCEVYADPDHVQKRLTFAQDLIDLRGARPVFLDVPAEEEVQTTTFMEGIVTPRLAAQFPKAMEQIKMLEDELVDLAVDQVPAYQALLEELYVAEDNLADNAGFESAFRVDEDHLGKRVNFLCAALGYGGESAELLINGIKRLLVEEGKPQELEYVEIRPLVAVGAPEGDVEYEKKLCAMFPGSVLTIRWMPDEDLAGQTFRAVPTLQHGTSAAGNVPIELQLPISRRPGNAFDIGACWKAAWALFCEAESAV